MLTSFSPPEGIQFLSFTTENQFPEICVRQILLMTILFIIYESFYCQYIIMISVG